MFVKLWGVRGSICAPLSGADYRARLRRVLALAIEQEVRSPDQIEKFISSLDGSLRSIVGGNTTCVSVQESPEAPTRIIIDAGTGIRIPGDRLFASRTGKEPCEFHILLTHTHWDHIQGLPFFKPIYIPGNVLHFYSPYQDLEERLKDQFDRRFFPVLMNELGARFEFHTIADLKTPFSLPGGFTVTGHPLKHPGGSVAYRLERNNKTFIFATDAEFTGEVLEHTETEIRNFFKNADLLVMDTQYTLDESFQKFDWGHTSNTMAVNCAVHWSVKNLAMTHHEPAYSDEKLFLNLQEAILHRNNLGRKKPFIHLASEGTGFWLKSK